MVTENTIKRINELYHKSKGEGLTKEEAEEQIYDLLQALEVEFI